MVNFMTPTSAGIAVSGDPSGAAATSVPTGLPPRLS